MKSIWTREKRTKCGPDYMEVDLYAITLGEHLRTRGRKCRASSEGQRQRNKAHARRFRLQKANANFSARGYYWTGTYDDAYLPDSMEQAKRDFRNFVRRVEDAAARVFGLPRSAIRVYGIVAGPWADPKGHGGKGNRYHNHALIEAVGLTPEQNMRFRQVLNGAWTTGRGKAREELGTPRALELRMTGRLAGLMQYLEDHEYKGELYWYQSRNLVLPKPQRPNDSRWSTRALTEACRECETDAYFWEQKYPGWRFVRMVVVESGAQQEPRQQGEKRTFEPSDFPHCYVAMERRKGYCSKEGLP
jgi:hypothetical protein